MYICSRIHPLHGLCNYLRHADCMQGETGRVPAVEVGLEQTCQGEASALDPSKSYVIWAVNGCGPVHG